MGSVGQVFSILSGFSSGLMPKGHEQESKTKIKRYMTMMDSMTNEELDSFNLKLMNESRMMRIARGSGHQVREVMDMMEEYKRLAKIWSKMQGLKISKKGDMSASRNMNDTDAKTDWWHGWLASLDETNVWLASLDETNWR